MVIMMAFKAKNKILAPSAFWQEKSHSSVPIVLSYPNTLSGV